MNTPVPFAPRRRPLPRLRLRPQACLLVLAAVLLASCTSMHSLPPSASAAAVVDAAEGRARLVELSQVLDSQSTLFSDWLGWPFEILDEQTATGARRTISVGEHTGTHMDAPVHFLASGANMDDSRAEDLIRPACVVDVRDAARNDPRLPIGVEDLQAWESAHGAIPEGAIVFLLTGHVRQGVAESRDHPGLTAGAADWLRQNRNIAGVGTDALSPDIGGSGAYPVHERLLADECIILENVRSLDELPATGFHVLMGPLLVVDGSGSPTRVVAILDSTSTSPWKLRELTFPLGGSTPYEGSEHDPEQARRNPRTGRRVERGGTSGITRLLVNAGYLALLERTGTYVAFPGASVAGGADGASFPIEKLIGRIARLDLTDLEANAAVSAAEALARLDGVDLHGAIVAVQTRRWWNVGAGRLSRDYPGLSPEAARALMERGASGIIAQSGGIDPFPVESHPAEHAVHEAGGFTGGFLRLPRVQPRATTAQGQYLAILPLRAAGASVVPARILVAVPD